MWPIVELTTSVTTSGTRMTPRWSAVHWASRLAGLELLSKVADHQVTGFGPIRATTVKDGKPVCGIVSGLVSTSVRERVNPVLPVSTLR